MRWILVAALVASVGLAGCAVRPPVPPHAVVKTDQFSSTASVIGPSMFDNPFGGIDRSWHLRTIIDKKSGLATDQLYVEISYIGDWKYFNAASDQDATDLPVTVIDRSVGDCYGGCSLYETVGVGLDDAKLRAHAATGYAIKLYAHDGDSLILPITPQMISLQMAAIDKYTSKRVGAK